jgi:ABC-type lipoprotein release transport system permease subunit
MYKLHLILKYLRRRRIAWVSLAAVMLCTTMVIVVISIMGGWLRMYETSARGMTGDVVIKSAGLSGFPYYEEMVRRIEAQPYVVAAVPQIKTMGLVNIYGQKTEGVQVFGVQINQTARVNDWPNSLYRQHTLYTDAGRTPPAVKTFDLRTETTVRLGRLPAGLRLYGPVGQAYEGLWRALAWAPVDADFVLNLLDDLPIPVAPVRNTQWDTLLAWLHWEPEFLRPIAAALPPDPVWDRVRVYSPLGGTSFTSQVNSWTRLTLRGKVSDADRAALDAAAGSRTRGWGEVVRGLVREANQPGMIAGSRLLDIRKDVTGALVGRDEWKYQSLWAKLTVLGIGANEEFDEKDRIQRTYSVVDDSRTGMWQYDNTSVYVDFDTLQKDLGMDARDEELLGSGEKVTRPARTSEINVKLKPGADLLAARDGVERIVKEAVAGRVADGRLPRVETWRQASRTYLDAIEKEKGLVVILFGIISLVAVFLIFCIFYMIVAEKTRDIGIVKSVGATSWGVAGIFLGYGLAIGIVGAGLGLMLSYAVVHNINQIHTYIGRELHLVVWNPEVYAFDTIPNEMNPPEVAVILVVAVIASVLGALVPAVAAAKKHPVESLRWE